MPIEFTQYPPQENTGVSGDTLYKMAMAYDGTGRRVSKTRWVKARGDAGWQRRHVTHYTGIGTEVRENFAGPAKETKVVVTMPQGLGRYGIEDADHAAENGSAQTFEWYLKNHLGSTMLVYGTGAGTPGGLLAAYDYRSFGEQIELTSPSTGKVTENFTGKEKDDETELNYFGARYLDPMLGMWTSVDPARQFASPYLYAGNGMNPVNIVDFDGNDAMVVVTGKANDERQNGEVTIKGEKYYFDFTVYRLDIYLKTENWEEGQTYSDYTPDASYWASRDAWMKAENKAVISGDGYLKPSEGDKGKAKGWLAIENGKNSTFIGVSGLKDPDIWSGESMHPGTPMHSEGCVTSRSFPQIRAKLWPDLKAKKPVKIHFETFTPEQRPSDMPYR
jgi:RHS repeat-associated protein